MSPFINKNKWSRRVFHIDTQIMLSYNFYQTINIKSAFDRPKKRKRLVF